MFASLRALTDEYQINAITYIIDNWIGKNQKDNAIDAQKNFHITKKRRTI